MKKAMILLLVCCLLGGSMLLGFPQNALAEGTELSPADLYEQNVNSTVGITISARTTSRYGYGDTYQASGSGFIITEDGYILTNYHVIEDYDTVTVATFDNQTYEAEVIGYDAGNDIAVIKINAENLKPVTLGDSDELRVGDTVMAIGNPLGELTFSLTRGIVSGLSRDMKLGSGNTMSLIQTDCAINSGNSGGALFNIYGEVVGITNAKYSASGYGEAEIDNIGFAIPINSVKRIVTSIIENGYIIKPFIGVSVSQISEDIAGITGIKAGAWVREVVEGEAAEQAGILVNDVIIRVEDAEINGIGDLTRIISNSEPGDALTFYIYRQGEELELDVTVGSKTESALKEEEEAAAQETPRPAPEDGQGYGDDYDWGDFPMEDFFNYWGEIPMEDFFRFFGNAS